MILNGQRHHQLPVASLVCANMYIVTYFFVLPFDQLLYLVQVEIDDLGSFGGAVALDKAVLHPAVDGRPADAQVIHNLVSIN